VKLQDWRIATTTGYSRIYTEGKQGKQHAGASTRRLSSCW